MQYKPSKISYSKCNTDVFLRFLIRNATFGEVGVAFNIKNNIIANVL